MSAEIIKQGAEAKLYLGDFNGQPCLIKERFLKKYRHPDLDLQLTKERIRAETKAISRCCAAGIRAPKFYHMDLKERKIYMEYLANSKTVKEFINDSSPNINDVEVNSKVEDVCKAIGEIVGKLHAHNIIHGDLTTSNILMNPLDDDEDDGYDLVIIDFGLSHYSQNVEDKGVDLYVLERALISTHSDLPNLFDFIIESYKKLNENEWKEVISKYEEVRARGRKRTMVG